MTGSCGDGHLPNRVVGEFWPTEAHEV